MLEASIVTATVACEKSPSGTSTVPDQRANVPRTLAITRCLTEKCTLEWLLSISHRFIFMAPPDLGPHPVDAGWDRNRSARTCDPLFSMTCGVTGGARRFCAIKLIGSPLIMRVA